MAIQIAGGLGASVNSRWLWTSPMKKMRITVTGDYLGASVTIVQSPIGWPMYDGSGAGGDKQGVIAPTAPVEVTVGAVPPGGGDLIIEEPTFMLRAKGGAFASGTYSVYVEGYL